MSACSDDRERSRRDFLGTLAGTATLSWGASRDSALCFLHASF
jgi:hypothetical protein